VLAAGGVLPRLVRGGGVGLGGPAADDDIEVGRVVLFGVGEEHGLDLGVGDQVDQSWVGQHVLGEDGDVIGPDPACCQCCGGVGEVVAQCAGVADRDGQVCPATCGPCA
jgi:hypothetical protein